MTGSAAVLKHHIDARDLRNALAAAGIAGTIRTTLHGVRLVGVNRKDGRGAEKVAKEAGA